MKNGHSSPGGASPALCAFAAVLLILAVCASTASAQSVRTPNRQVVEIASGVYAIIHEDVSDDWPQGNTLVVVGDDGVFVLDACLLRKTALEDVAEIRRLTDKPVRYLAISHWHIDHNGGTSAYVDAWPNLEIIAHAETRRIMDAVNPGVGSRWSRADGPLAAEIAALKRSVETGTDAEGKPLTPEEKAALPRRIADRERQHADYGAFRYEPPNLVFDTSLAVDLGGRTVEVKHLGRGNTHGDAIVYLPKERILATGDLLVAPVPYMRGSYPTEWRETLRRISEMDPAVIVPGHGPIMRDLAHLDAVRALLDSVIEQVAAQVANVTKVEELKVDLEPFRKRMAGDDPVNNLWWDELVVNGLIERVFLQAKGRL